MIKTKSLFQDLSLFSNESSGEVLRINRRISWSIIGGTKSLKSLMFNIKSLTTYGFLNFNYSLVMFYSLNGLMRIVTVLNRTDTELFPSLKIVLLDSAHQDS